MKKAITVFAIMVIAAIGLYSMQTVDTSTQYRSSFRLNIQDFSEVQTHLLGTIAKTDINTEAGKETIKKEIAAARRKMKGIDIWLRYLEPIAYKKINGPLPVEWETEVFEKFEAPYKREGAGLTLAELYVEEEGASKDSLKKLVQLSIDATSIYLEDSITSNLETHHHFFLANRLFLLNLAAIYTTGFECPDTSRIIPELQAMLQDVETAYQLYNQGFPGKTLSEDYLGIYQRCIDFVRTQPSNYSDFDHFTFLRDYINPLFKINQQLMMVYKVYTKSFIDYSINNSATSIFSKDLYFGQSSKGIFRRVTDPAALAEIQEIGKLLFYDPILSGNDKRSCNSCHKSTQYFADTSTATSLQFDGKHFLPRNTPSLINATYNHLLMADGKHISLQKQARAVMMNGEELGSEEKALVEKVLSCNDYKNAFKRFLKYTPQETEITYEHIASALTIYYSKFSEFSTNFDNAMTAGTDVEPAVKTGFNLFMSKAQCGTCHFVPQFNGVKPPYVGSEFEVLGVPADTLYSRLSPDKGRHNINPSVETLNAFRTGSLRNIAHTKPYMHNGVFTSLQQVVDFYDGGGGAGRGLQVANQTLSSDSLHLSPSEKNSLVLFMTSLTENIKFEADPVHLPASKNKLLNTRLIGGVY